MKEITSQWLQETNQEFKVKGIVDAQSKIWNACQKWRRENVSDLLKDENPDYQKIGKYLEVQEKKIKEYFVTQREIERGFIGPHFYGVFYYSMVFWRVVIPEVLGRVQVNPLDSLEDLPEELNLAIRKDESDRNQYISVWCDCIDYGFGIREVENKCASEYSKQLFQSGDKHLRATISLLLQEKPSSKAIEDARMSIEIFLKAFLSAKIIGFNDNDARKQVGHDLEKGSKLCIENGLVEIDSIKAKLKLFPEVEARYDAEEKNFGELWEAYRTAQFIATTVIRNITDRDTRKSIVVRGKK
jgi:hypothetical protein